MSFRLFMVLNKRKYLNFFLILNLIFIFSNSQVKIPLKYFPIFKYNDTNPSEIFKSLILTYNFSDKNYFLKIIVSKAVCQY